MLEDDQDLAKNLFLQRQNLKNTVAKQKQMLQNLKITSPILSHPFPLTARDFIFVFKHI